MKFKEIEVGGEPIRRPIVVAGPCSAESEGQMMATATALAEIGVTIFRAGIWKVRTRPGGFTGPGEPGLEWLQNVKKATGMAVTTEVGTAKHTEAALKSGVDILWIGARTTSDPFAVDEIAEVLRGVDIPVMIKNPIAPDLDLWIGAIERIYGVGIRSMAAIFRGFCCYPRGGYRNTPIWPVATSLKEHFPDLPLLFDPSHSTGNKDMIAAECYTAVAKGCDGLFVEAHYKPASALTDASQQLTPEELKKVLVPLGFLPKQ